MRAIALALFDRGGLSAAFEHARNLVVATFIVAAGFETVSRFDTIDLPGLLSPLFAGYVVAGTGCLLISLNFIDGLRKLAKLRWHFLLQTALGIVYLLFSLRIVQLILLFRSHTC
ncbi:hypothetical protein PQR75_14815 [Paraburkholderia fungorum]|jgi:hypothetical protein|uniref:hypothetical protein n=1 Tax=Paraburkholderia fungorum TaxID=134537 RepID=UPI0038BB0574